MCFAYKIPRDYPFALMFRLRDVGYWLSAYFIRDVEFSNDFEMGKINNLDVGAHIQDDDRYVIYIHGFLSFLCICSELYTCFSIYVHMSISIHQNLSNFDMGEKVASILRCCDVIHVVSIHPYQRVSIFILCFLFKRPSTKLILYKTTVHIAFCYQNLCRTFPG